MKGSDSHELHRSPISRRMEVQPDKAGSRLRN